jgi:TonB family protein
MTAATQKSAMTEAWTQWEGQVVNGIYPLRRFLNASDHSSVFLTESSTEGFLNAAIKLVPVPADPELIAVQLWHWKTATTFSHPHLIRLLDSGQCEIEGRPFLFVVMEYAEETLSQILPIRALEPAEVRQLLVPTLDALAFLHRESWVQGQLKPSNFLVVNDQLKLASDTIRPAGVARERGGRLSLYDSPESERGEVSAAADVWALGVTLVETLTQYLPTWPNGRSEPPSLPPNLPLSFAGTMQRCLSPNPADRPTVADLQAETKPTPSVQQDSPAPAAQVEPVAPVPQPEPVIRATPHPYSPSPEAPKRSLSTPTIAAAVVVLLVAVWGGSRLFHGHSKGERPTEGTALQQSASPPAASPEQLPAAAAPESPPQPPASAPRPPESQPQLPASQTGVPPHASRPAEQRRHPLGNTSSAVIHEEIPKVPKSARATIHGHVKVAVRVSVDRSGNVVRDRFENAGPSRYFNHLASEAARKWKFTPDNEGSREWLLRFEFGRDGTTVHATRSRS